MMSRVHEMTREEKREAIRIGKVIRRLRMGLGMNGRAFARHVGLSAGFISQIETGVRIPRLSSLMTIAFECGVPFSDVLVMIAAAEYPGEDDV